MTPLTPLERRRYTALAIEIAKALCYPMPRRQRRMMLLNLTMLNRILET